MMMICIIFMLQNFLETPLKTDYYTSFSFDFFYTDANCRKFEDVYFEANEEMQKSY